MEAERHASPTVSPAESLTVRNARLDDAQAIATVLAQAFPSLYQSTFSLYDQASMVSLLHSLYMSGHLSLEDTRVAVIDGTVAGVMILHTGLPIGRGSAIAFWHLLRKHYGLILAARMYFGAITANLMLNRRIPSGPDLVYIEALAVRESYRGQGIGSRMLADAETWARARSRSRLSLHVLTNNTRARRLYVRTGFTPWYEREPPPRWQHPLLTSSWSAILMTRLLTD